MRLESYELFNSESTAFFYNLKAKPIQHMLDFDFLSRREKPSVSAIIHPGSKGYHKCFFGGKQMLIPIYSSLKEAVEKHPDTSSLINFASFRSAFDSTKEALAAASIKTITIVAEGIPERQTKELIALAKQKGKTLIGPATVGGVVAGQFRVGNAGGMNENILRAKLCRPGSIGLVSRSGGMINEFFNILSRVTDGVYEGMAIGGDQFPGSTMLDHMLRYEANPKIKMIVALGEVGGKAEYEIIEAKKQGRLTKPIIMWVSGTCASIFPWEVQFGHAGAKAGSEQESAQEKNKTLRLAGIIVPESFEVFEQTIAEEFCHLGSEPAYSKGTGRFKKQSLSERKMEPVPELGPRRKTHFTSTISDDRGEELTYNKVPISELVGSSLGEVIGLLWFKKKLPDYFTKFLDR